MFRNRAALLAIPSHLSSHREPSLAFIDANNVWVSYEKRLKELGIAANEFWLFEFSRLFKIIEHDRCYVYTAIPSSGEKPAWLMQLERSNGFLVRTARLVEKEGKRRKQEGVDVKLAIDTTRFAFSDRMSSCTIYGADGDFIPLVEAVTDSGTIVTVASFSDPEQGDVAPKLRDLSDRYVRMDRIWIYETLKEEHSTIARDRNVQHEWRSGEIIDLDTPIPLNYEVRRFDLPRAREKFALRVNHCNGETYYFSTHSKLDLSLWLRVAPFKEDDFSLGLMS